MKTNSYIHVYVGKPIYIHSDQKCCFSERDFNLFYKLFKDYSIRHSLNQSPETATTILTEIIKNAEKSNAKKLLLENPSHYVDSHKLQLVSMDGNTVYKFSEDIDFHSILQGSGKWIKVDIALDGDTFIVNVVNNSSLQTHEKIRINQVIELMEVEQDFVNLYSHLNPKAEMGGGIGLAMSLQLLKSEGISPHHLKIADQGNVTYCDFRYPPVNQEKCAV